VKRCYALLITTTFFFFEFVQVVLGAFTNGQLTTWNFKSVEIVRETNLNAAPSFIQINRHR
jgi:hypothetical protein